MAEVQQAPGSLRRESDRVSLRAEARYRATRSRLQETQLLRGSSRISGKGFRPARGPTICAWPQRGGNFLLSFPRGRKRPYFLHFEERIPCGCRRRRQNVAGAGRSGSKSTSDFANLSKAVQSSRG